MIKIYSIPLFPQIMEAEDYAKSWLEDCLERCQCSQTVEDYELKIEENFEGHRRAVFILKNV
ncbi:MAG: hypothetical protein NE327_21265 [Lentisphaeraceae bacterium]|nr:hypothetical protein [Lentisphaeraceae bacterium]